MSGVLRQPMSIEPFLAWEDAQPTRFEFDGFHVHAMTGGSADHAAVRANLITALVGRLRGTSCRAFGSELKIITAGCVRYPDAFVTCAPVQGKATALTEPVVAFEIISPSTSGVDRIIKNQEYRGTPSIQRYVILEQDRLAATVFSRDHGDWAGHVIAGDVELDMPEIGISIPLAELYAGIDLVDELPTLA